MMAPTHSSYPDPLPILETIEPRTLLSSAVGTVMMPFDGYLSAGVYDADGQLVRTLFARSQQQTGPVSLVWDGKDNLGRLTLQSGTYSWRALASQVQAVDDGFVGDSLFNPSVRYSDLEFQEAPEFAIQVAVGSDGSLYILSNWEEGPTLTRFAQDGSPIWRQGCVFGVSLAVDGDYVYAGWRTDDNRNFVTRYNVSDGTVVPFTQAVGGNISLTDAYDPRPAGQDNYTVEQQRMRTANWSLAASGSRLWVSNYRLNRIEVYNSTTGVKLGQFSLNQPLGILVDPQNPGAIWVSNNGDRVSRYTYTIDGQGVYTFTEDTGRRISNLSDPNGLSIGGSNNHLFVAEGTTATIREYDIGGAVPTPAGLGTFGELHTSGPITDSQFNFRSYFPYASIAVDPDGILNVNDYHRIQRFYTEADPGAGIAAGDLYQSIFGQWAGAPTDTYGYGENGRHFVLDSGLEYEVDPEYTGGPREGWLGDGTWRLSARYYGGTVRRTLMDGETQREFIFGINGDGTITAYALEPSGTRRAAIVGAYWKGLAGLDFGQGGQYNWTDSNADGIIDWDPQNPNPDNGEITWYVPLGYAPHLRAVPWVDDSGNIWESDNIGNIIKVPLNGFDAQGNPLYDWADQVIVAPYQDDDLDFVPNSIRIAANGDIYALGNSPYFGAPGAVHGGSIVARYDSNGNRLVVVQAPELTLAAMTPDDSDPDSEYFFAGTGAGFQHVIYMFSNDGLLVTRALPGAASGYVAGWTDHPHGVTAFTHPVTGELYVYAEEVYYGKDERYRIDNLDTIQRQEGNFDYVAPRNVMGNWGFDGNLADSAGSITGTFIGGTASYQPGVTGQAIDLDGNDDHVTVLYGADTKAYTISAWIKATDVTSVNVLARLDASGNRSHQIRINSSGQFEHATTAGTEQVVTGTTTVQSGVWYHVAIVAESNGIMRLFVNGQEEGAPRSISSLWTGGDRFDIGGNTWGGFDSFGGLIDDVRVFEAPLTATEIAALYASVPTVTAAATDAIAAEQGAGTATFTISRTNSTGNLTVYYTVSGTAISGGDYIRLPGSVVIPNSQMSVIVTLTPIDDSLNDINETVILTITSGTGYLVGEPRNTATAFIAENEILDFSSNPGWVGFGNTTDGNSYGYSGGTSNAGGAAGEVGGTFARNDGRSYYADTNLTTKLTFSDTIHAYGKLTVFGQNNPDQNWALGHMSSNLNDGTFMGIEFKEGGINSVQFRVRTGHSWYGGADTDWVNLPNGDYNFEYTYDPHGALLGRLTVRIFNGSYDQTLTKDLESDGLASETFDAFGLGIRAGMTSNDDPSKTIQVFIDDVNYTGRRVSTAPTANGPSGAWSMDGNLANSATSGSAVFSDGTPSYVSGMIGSAIDLDGSNDYVDLGYGTNRNMYTVTAWVKPGDAMWVNILGRSKSGLSQQLRINGQGKFEQVITSAGSDKTITGTTTVQADTWYHVAISVSSNGVTRLYVNGQQEGEFAARPAGTLWSPSDSFHVGEASGTAGFFDGLVDDVRVYDRALGASDIQAVFGEIDAAVSIMASDLNAAEHGANTGSFIVSRHNSIGDLTVNYSISGTAANGSDYSSLSGSVVIPNGKTSARIAVTPVDDILIESKETIVLTVVSGSGYTLGGPRTATVTIADNDPTVTVIATDANASEAGADTGAFTISRNNTIGSLTVNYVINGMAVGGADYTALSGSVVIPAGQASAPVTVIPMDNQYAEGNEDVILTLNLGNGYVIGAARRAVVTIADDDTLPADVDFSTDPGWTGVGNLTDGNYYHYSGGTSFAGGSAGEVGGLFARNTGESYYADTNLAGTFTLNDSITARGKLTIFGQVYTNGEWFVGHLSSSTSDNSMIGMEFMDQSNGSVRVQARMGVPGLGGAESPAIDLPNGDYNFEYTYDPGIGYGRLTVRIYSGSFDQTVVADLHYDERPSGAAFDAFGMGIRAGSVAADDPGLTVQTYIDDVSYDGWLTSLPTVTVSASDDASEADTGTFTVTRTETAANLTVHYTVGGTATSGSDYAALSGSVVIPTGQTSATITVTPIDDDAIESSETVILTLSAGTNYAAGTPGSATVTIADNDPSVTVTVTDAAASEPGVDTGTFTITRNNAAGDVTVNYTIGGTATSGSDYVALSGSVVIPDGQTSATVTVTPIDNGASESTETVILTLSAGSGYSVVSPASASVMIEDDDGTTPDVTFSTDPGWVGNGNVIGPPGNNYGYSSGTSYAGGTAGEAGGTFARNDGESSYADTNLARAYNLNDVITAKGKLTVFGQAATDGNWFVGHLSSGTSDRSMIGISMKERDATSASFMARMEMPGGGGAESGLFMLPNGDYNFEYTYDPTIGAGRLTVRIYNLSYDQTAVANFSFGERNSGSTFNAFGLGITAGMNSDDGPTQTVKTYIDDVAYTGFVRAGDGFEGGTSGGSGWSGSWVLGGGAAIVGTGVPNTGSNHLRLTGNGASASRAINMAGVSPARLVLDWKADNFEPGETALVEIYSSTGWVTVLTISDGQDDNAYHHADIDLSAYSLTSTFQVRFTSLMSDADDLFYVDDVMIVR